MKVQWFVENVRVGDKSYLFSILDNIIPLIEVHLLDGANRSSAWSDLLGRGGAGISLVNSVNPVSHVEDHETIGLLVHKHDIVAELQLPIVAIGLGHSLETLGKLLLGLVNHQFSLVLLV